MDFPSELIRSYTSSGLSPAVVKAWYELTQPNEDLLSILATGVGAAFLAREIDFDTANGLLNQIMPLAGFDKAPKRFWEYYVAFEDYETSSNPDEAARAAVLAVRNAA